MKISEVKNGCLDIKYNLLIDMKPGHYKDCKKLEKGKKVFSYTWFSY